MDAGRGNRRDPGRRLRGSVRLRVTLAAAGLFAIALTIASFALVRSVHDNLTSEIQRTNDDQLNEVARQIQAGTDPANVQIPDAGRVGPPNLRAVGPGGRRIELPVNGIGPAVPRDQARVRTQRTIETAQGTVTLVSERSLAEVDSTVANVTNALLVGVPVLFALVAALTWWIAGRALRPVEAIRAEAAAITGSTLHRRVPEPTSDDEVGRLARTMNSMLDRLEETSLRQRRFVSDASHELRSPVAAIRAQVEVAMRRGEAADWPEVARRVLDEDQRLEQAVAELLELARAEEGATVDRVEVDLDGVVLEETARVRRVPIDTSGVSAGRVLGSEAQLARGAQPARQRVPACRIEGRGHARRARWQRVARRR